MAPGVLDHRLRRKHPGNDVLRDHGQPDAVTACIATQEGERLLHVQAPVLSEDALGLFKDDATGERGLKLLVDRCGVGGRSVLDEGDAREQGPCLECCSWMTLSSRVAAEDAARTCSTPWWSARFTEKVEDVVPVDQAGRQRHERPGHLGLPGPAHRGRPATPPPRRQASSSSVRRLSTMAQATSLAVAPWAKAWARSRRSASVASTSNAPMIMPVAW